MLNIAGASRKKEAWLFQLSVMDGSLLTAKLEDFVADFVVACGAIASCSALAAVVPSVVQCGVAQRAEFFCILAHAKTVAQFDDVFGSGYREPLRGAGYNVQEVFCTVLTF